ncbi:putative membrane protein [Mycobacterium kansasii]|uniref:Putative membrane protein n=1 Tax=Mycobacterium kansasii TaxID=1768 RepID=A0A1V3XWC1_MYCKA|nr:putative membrane protein [Mycobacterium kansasii]
MRNARPAGSDELWLAGLLAVDGLAALLFAGRPAAMVRG